jgi:hypothetical protein
MTFLLFEPKSMEKFQMINLAEREMELTLLQRNYLEERKQEMIGRKSYLLKKIIEPKDHLVKIQIEVVHSLTGKVIFSVRTVRKHEIP